MRPFSISPRTATSLTVLSAAMFLVANCPAASFQDLSPLDIMPCGISADGNVVIGRVNQHAGIWTSATGAMDISGTANGSREWSFSNAISADGNIVVGTKFLIRSFEVFRWTSATGATPLAPDSPFDLYEATGASADGSVIAGNMSGVFVEGDHPTDHAYRWTSATGPVDLGVLPGCSRSSASGISGDGSVVVGSSANWFMELLSSEQPGPLILEPGIGFPPQPPKPPKLLEAFRWTEAGGMVGLGFLPGTGSSWATAVSADGSVIVGLSGGKPFRWTEANGMTDLAINPGGISADGSVIVGESDGYAARWDVVHGMQSIASLLTASGIDMTGWSLRQATAVSADGSVIVGIGTYNWNQFRVWRAELPVIPDLPATPTPTPSADVAPVISIAGQTERTTSRSKILLKGRATGAVTSVTYSVSNASPARRTITARPRPHGDNSRVTRWRFVVRLKPGKNIVTVVAHGPGGDSDPAQVIVTRE